MTELKPCPFCGGEVDISSCSANTGKHIIRGTFDCNHCGAKITLKTEYNQFPVSELEDAWNRRYEPVSEIDYDYEAEDD